MRELKIRLLPGEGFRYDSKDSVVVVIDVLRATTTIPVLLFKGASKVIPTDDIDFALSLTEAVKIGERKSVKIPNFDFNNSPTKLMKLSFKGKDTVLTTSNGTKTALIYKDFKELIALSFANFSVVKDYLLKKDKVVLVCSGSHSEFSLEDFVCAKLMADSLSYDGGFDTLNLAKLLKVDFNNYKEVCLSSHHARSLIEKGFKSDVEFSLKLDTANVLPIYKSDAFVRGDL